MNNEAIIVAVITGLLTYFGTKKQTEYQLKGKEVEADANTEGMYVQNMSMILAEYKEQVSGFREELRVVKAEFSDFRREHYKKIEEYKIYVEELEEEIDALKDERNDLKLELSYLKGENDG
ncbi:hypothetical protein SAMN04488102_101373 [Alkalibacterium subtropicum]|uniref:Uncharacterized protein n=1 Tax=Alkalibacterium subtropicum TaxID=753702 RepID=A0A1I1EVF1_9LACT|nr:hypothetical protein [Alkalibacterium subtropicum]SFB91021.1 hypothetical protein SAMN04488102_101373 [Alkalibacterium subtropicum]